MTIKRALQLADEYIRRVTDLYTFASISGYSRERLFEGWRNLINESQFKSLPAWAQWYVRGFEKAKHNDLWHSLIREYMLDGDIIWYRSDNIENWRDVKWVRYLYPNGKEFIRPEITGRFEMEERERQEA